MKYRFLMAAVLFLSVNTLLLSRADSPAPKGKPVAEKLEGDTVNLRLLKGTLPVVDCTINGKGPFTLVLDTGSDTVVIRPAMAKKLKVPLSGAMSQGELGVGKAVVKNLNIALADVPQLQKIEGDKDLKDEKICGLLGYPFLKNYRLTLDYKKKTLGLVPNSEKAKENKGEKANFALAPDTGIILQAKINDKGPYKFMFDTGASHIFLGPRLAKQFELKLHEETTVKSVSVGNLTFKDLEAVPLANLGGNWEGVLGYPFLKNCITTIDYANKTITFEKNE